jgi:hypothetical protein
MQSRFYDPMTARFLQPDTIVPDPMLCISEIISSREE